MKAVRHIVTNGNVIKLCSLSQVGDKDYVHTFDGLIDSAVGIYLLSTAAAFRQINQAFYF